MVDFNKCEGCPIYGEYEPTEPNGDPESPYLIVTDKPSVVSAQKRTALPPGQTKKLMEHMEPEEVYEEDFHYHPLCLCPYNDDAIPNKMKTKVHKHCRVHLEDYIEETQPEAILPLGAAAASTVMGRSVQITKVRGLGHDSEEFGTVVFPLMSPLLALRYPQNEAILAADCRSFGRLVNAGMSTEEADSHLFGEYVEVDDLEFLIEQNPELLSFDMETTGLRWYNTGPDVRTYREDLHKGEEWFQPRAQILTMQFTIEPGKSYVLVWDHPERPIPEHRKPKLRNQLRRLLCNPDTMVVGVNVKFDNVYLWMVEGIRFRISGDANMLAAIHDENLPEKNLDILTKIYAPEMGGYADRFNQLVDKGRMWEANLDDLVQYGGGDTDASYRVYEVLEELVAEDEGSWNYYVNVSLPGLNAFASMETRGKFVDDREDGALEEFRVYLEEIVSEQRASLLRQVPKTIKREHIEKNPRKPVEEVLSFTRAALIKDVLFNHPDGFRLTPKVFTATTAKLPPHLQEPSVSSKDHLPLFFTECQFAYELAEHVKDATLLRNNVLSFKEKFVRGGKVRPTYSLSKAVTRRSSSADPNGQNEPSRGAKARRYKRIYKSKPGYYIISRDLSQAELRIAGEMARDPIFTKIYNEDGDIHVSTACIVLGVTEEQFLKLPSEERKSARQKAKAVNFGFIYGMSWRKFILYAKTDYGVTFTEKEAQRIRTAFFTKYKGLATWHETTKRYARKYKFVRSLMGLVRHLPMIDSPDEGVSAEAERQAINSPVQEVGSSLGVSALGRMDEDLDPDAMEVIGFVHDAIYAYVKCEYLEWGLKTLGEYMEYDYIGELTGYKMRIPIKSDPSFGENMGDLIELEDFPRGDEEYDWEHSCMKDKEGNLLVEVPEQKTPPRNGRRRGSPYTMPGDLEPEVAVRRVGRSRPSANRTVRRVRRAQAV